MITEQRKAVLSKSRIKSTTVRTPEDKEDARHASFSVQNCTLVVAPGRASSSTMHFCEHLIANYNKHTVSSSNKITATRLISLVSSLASAASSTGTECASPGRRTPARRARLRASTTGRARPRPRRRRRHRTSRRTPPTSPRPGRGIPTAAAAAVERTSPALARQPPRSGAPPSCTGSRRRCTATATEASSLRNV